MNDSHSNLSSPHSPSRLSISHLKLNRNKFLSPPEATINEDPSSFDHDATSSMCKESRYSRRLSIRFGSLTRVESKKRRSNQKAKVKQVTQKSVVILKNTQPFQLFE
jgi:hypothetical protein